MGDCDFADYDNMKSLINNCYYVILSDNLEVNPNEEVDLTGGSPNKKYLFLFKIDLCDTNMNKYSNKQILDDLCTKNKSVLISDKGINGLIIDLFKLYNDINFKTKNNYKNNVKNIIDKYDIHSEPLKQLFESKNNLFKFLFSLSNKFDNNDYTKKDLPSSVYLKLFSEIFYSLIKDNLQTASISNINNNNCQLSIGSEKKMVIYENDYKTLLNKDQIINSYQNIMENFQDYIDFIIKYFENPYIDYMACGKIKYYNHFKNELMTIHIKMQAQPLSFGGKKRRTIKKYKK
jgi:hypothetical protein